MLIIKQQDYGRVKPGIKYRVRLLIINNQQKSNKKNVVDRQKIRQQRIIDRWERKRQRMNEHYKHQEELLDKLLTKANTLNSAILRRKWFKDSVSLY